MTAASHEGTIIAQRQGQPRGVFERLLPVSFAVLYAAFLTNLPLDIFKDRENYFVYIGYSDVIFTRYTSGGFLATLANEPLWLILNIGLSRLLYPENAMRVLIFVPAFLVSWQLIKRDQRHAVWMVAFLLSPQVVKNHIIHLRQGVAIGVFLVGYFATSTWLRLAFIAAACLIHSSFLFICVIGLGSWSLKELRFSPRAQAAVFILGFAVIGVIVEVFAGGMAAVAGQLGARQALVYADANLDISGIGFVFWGIIFLLFVSSGDDFIRRNNFAISVLAFYLVAYFLTAVAGRVFESGMFLVFLAGLGLWGWRRNAFLIGFLVLAFGQYYTRLGEPWLGFGIW